MSDYIARCSDPEFHRLMQRFSPHRSAAGGEEEPTESRRLKKAAQRGAPVTAPRKARRGTCLPWEVWAKIIAYLPHVSHLISLGTLCTTLRVGIWSNHTLLCAIYAHYFHWDPNAPRAIKGAMPIPREVSFYMPEHGWKDLGVPLSEVDRFNRHIAQLCRTSFWPWCTTCRTPLAPDTPGTLSIFPRGRLCAVCKLDGAFISDYELWHKYHISLKHRIGPAPRIESEAPPLAASPSVPPKKKMASARPPSKLKMRRGPAAAHNPFYRHDTNGELEAVSFAADTSPALLRPTVLERLIKQNVFFFTHRGTRQQRLTVTSSPINLLGPHMNQTLNMVFFLKTDIERVFDLTKARTQKHREDRAAVVIAAAVLRRASTRDIAWALPWASMTPDKRRIVWERISAARQHRVRVPMQNTLPWDPLNAVEFQYAQTHQYLLAP